jgi:hypothetical protein
MSLSLGVPAFAGIGDEEAAALSATPYAVVNKLNGNQNELTITIIEMYSDGTSNRANPIKATFMIKNNAAGTYPVGHYSVYVDTKGNTQIRECYIVK